MFNGIDTPPTVSANDAAAIEVGMRFSSDTAGYVTGVRFYKTPGNDGEHIGSLWSESGTRLAAATFTGESALGWQQVQFDTPVAVTADTTYVVSYHAPFAHYAATAGYFGVAKDAAPLHAPAAGATGNGLYAYGVTSAFPRNTFNANNYWVDIVFDTTLVDSTPPVVQSTAPSANASAAPKRGNVLARFPEALDPASVTSSTAELRTAANALVPATVSYDAATRAIVIDPTGSLAPTTTYTATIVGGDTAPHVTDVAGNALAASYTWTFTTAGQELEDGPGGPILVIGSETNPYSWYTAELLRGEGLNEFDTVDAADITATLLAAHDVAVLGDVALTSAQVTTLTTWVNGGGNLISFRPDKQLATLAGITDQASTLANAYLKVDTSAAPGTGIVGQTMQFHGTADRYALGSATAVASLFDTATSATTAPAVTLRSVGSNGGQVATFTYDLARSVVLTRQGNSAWVGQERNGDSVIRSNDLFYGAKVGDIQADWIDLDKVAIPQADEQQRLLANVIGAVTADVMPLPRFWYLPGTRKAAIVHALDDHGTPNGTKGTFDAFAAASPTGCSVTDWECYRATAWTYPTASLTNTEAAAYHAAGFDIGSHINTGCSNYTGPGDIEASFSSELTAFATAFPSLPAQTGNRTHCIPWSDWDTMPKVELGHGIRIDMGYYYWPAAWVQNRPGFFTGSGMPQRYAQVDGRMIDVYQTPNQLVNENGQTYPAATNTLLDRALGAEGYYGVFGTHDDYSNAVGVGSDGGFSNSIVASAKARGVAVVSADQMLKWLDGRNASSFTNIARTGSTLSFSVVAGATANNLSGMLPRTSAQGPLQSIKRGAATVAFTTETIKGVAYAFFPATTGTYTAVYGERTIFGNATPTVTSDPDTDAVEVGTRFRSDEAGTITGVRFYKGAGNTGTHTGHLWTNTGTLLGSVTFTSETATGWQVARFATPVTITADTTYVVSYHAPNGRYAGDTGFFASAVDSGPLHALASSGSSGNGVYAYGTAASFPSSSYQSSNYWVDVLFGVPAASVIEPPVDTGPTCPCTVFGATALPAVTSVDDSAAVELGMRVRSDIDGFITGVRFYKGTANTGTHTGSLWSSAGTQLATVTFSGETAAGWQEASFAAPVAVTAGTTYVVSYHAPVGGYAFTAGGFASGVINAPLQAPASAPDAPNGLFVYGTGTSFPTGSFNAGNYWVDAVFAKTGTTTPPADPPGSTVQERTLFGTSVPAVASANDTAAVEVGLKFRSDVSASALGVRFYKAAANTGTHTGHLWSATGTLLGSVTFTDETTNGWQEARFTTPIEITAHTTYVVSYYAPAGNYSGTNGGFAAAIDNGPLHGLANGTDGSNGVYRYGSTSGFPTSSWQASNYWVDVIVSS